MKYITISYIYGKTQNALKKAIKDGYYFIQDENKNFVKNNHLKTCYIKAIKEVLKIDFIREALTEDVLC